MRKKILLFSLRVARFFGHPEFICPDLHTIPNGSIRTGRLYEHYGRIMYTRRNPFTVTCKYTGDDGTPVPSSEVSARKANGHNIISVYTGKPCNLCACNELGLPCRCNFSSGPYTGYYTLLHTYPQSTTNAFLKTISKVQTLNHHDNRQ